MDDFKKDSDFYSDLLKLKGSKIQKADKSFFDKDANKTMKGDDFLKKIEKLKGLKKAGKIASKGLKAFPLIGGIMAGLASGDASAAIPILGDSEELGNPKDSLEGRFERGELTPEERIKFFEKMSK